MACRGDEWLVGDQSRAPGGEWLLHKLMMASIKADLPQEGTGRTAAGESLTAPSGAVCPVVSGGGQKPPMDNALSPFQNCAVLIEPLKFSGSKYFRSSLLSLNSECEMEAVCASGSSSRSGSVDRRKRAHSDSEGHAKHGVRKSAKRGKDRTPSKADFLKNKEEELFLEGEADITSVRRFRACRKEHREATATDLAKEVESGIRIILGVAARSKNLKGTFTRALKVAALQIEEATAEMHGRTSSEESSVLQAKNDRLQAELADLREEVAKLRSEVERTRPSEAFPPLPPPKTLSGNASEDVLDVVLPAVGRMLDAKLAGLEDRLLPEKRLRPPLRADSAALPAPVSANTPTAERGASNVGKPVAKPVSKGKGKGKGKAAKVPPPPPPTKPPRPLPPKPVSMDEGWSTVAKRGTRRQGATAPATAAPKTATAKPQKAAATTPAVAKKKVRSPTSSAVVLTLQPGAAERGLTYGSVMSEAKAKIELESLGIVGGVKCRQAVTGAFMLEVPGKDSSDKADALAAALRAVLAETDVRITRPVKRAELRINGLDDSVSTEEVASAVAAAGECEIDAVKIGSVVRTASAMGKVWVSCPVAAAKKVAVGGRLKIGWMICQVTLLDARPLRCYRCLKNGHVASRCTSEADRSGFCFRCGQTGHKARDCEGSLHCVLCAELGKPTEHRAGSASCHGAKASLGRKKRAVPRTQTAPAPSLATSPAASAAVEAMETVTQPSSD